MKTNLAILTALLTIMSFGLGMIIGAKITEGHYNVMQSQLKGE